MKGFVFGIVLMATVVSVLPSAGADERPALNPDRVAQLVRELDDASYKVRRRATEQLAAGDAEVVESLSSALTAGSLERRYRSLDVLGRIFSRHEEETFNVIDDVLVEIADGPNSGLAATAQNILDGQVDARQEFAVAEILRL